MSRDGDLRPMLRRKFPRWHWQAIESGATGSGVPDVNCCPSEGREFWLEAKVTGDWKIGSFKPAQSAWLERRARAGGRVFVAVRRVTLAGPRRGRASDQLWIIGGAYADKLRRLGLKAMTDREVLGMWDDGPSIWDWAEVGRILA